MQDIVKLLDEPDVSIAVVGATDNLSKYGHVIYRDLKRKGFVVYPVNPQRTSVNGDPAFPHVGDIPAKPTIINFVVPPSRTLKVLQECLDLDLMDAWVQPGAESPEVIAFLQQNNFNYIADACIMVATRLKA